MWTLTHAHYLQMGGFRLQCTHDEKRNFEPRVSRKIIAKYGSKTIDIWEFPLSFETIKAHLKDKNPMIDFLNISKDEILDKCGRDSFSKTIAVCQLTWFIIQIAARARQGLAVTELELTTAALASLNIAMYISWWSKPTDVLCPTIVTTKNLQAQIRPNENKHSVPPPSAPTLTVDNNCLDISSLSVDHVPSSIHPPDTSSSNSTANRDEEAQYLVEFGWNEKVNIGNHFGSEVVKALKSSMAFTSPAQSVSSFFNAFSTAFRNLFSASTTHSSPRSHHLSNILEKARHLLSGFSYESGPSSDLANDQLSSSPDLLSCFGDSRGT